MMISILWASDVVKMCLNVVLLIQDEGLGRGVGALSGSSNDTHKDRRYGSAVRSERLASVDSRPKRRCAKFV